MAAGRPRGTRFVRCFLIFARHRASQLDPRTPSGGGIYNCFTWLACCLDRGQPRDCNLVGGVWYLVSVYALPTSSFYWLFSHTQKNNINRGEFRTNFLDCFLVCFMIFLLF